MSETRNSRKNARLLELSWRMTKEERDAIWHAWHKGGRRWKATLRHAWMTGDYSPYDANQVATLLRLRNVFYFGPQGLDDYPSDGSLSELAGAR